jgi:predicted anti-sigma-YlaC factor YlaD
MEDRSLKPMLLLGAALVITFFVEVVAGYHFDSDPACECWAIRVAYNAYWCGVATLAVLVLRNEFKNRRK